LITRLTRRWTADDAQGRATTNGDHGLPDGIGAGHEYYRVVMLNDERPVSLFRFNLD
jgi:hypothetical protein